MIINVLKIVNEMVVLYLKFKRCFVGLFLIISLSPMAYSMPDMSKALSDAEFLTTKSKDFKLEVFKGKIILIFFGYTHCPDICPATLLDISKSMKELGKDAEKIQPIFISVDYKRDTPEHLATYVKFFDKRIIGITSDKKNIDKISQYFRTKYALLDAASENYIVEHSSNIYILDQSLQVRRIIANGLPSSEITRAVKKLLP